MSKLINVNGVVINPSLITMATWVEGEGLTVDAQNAHLIYKDNSDNARRAYEWLCSSENCVKSFTDDDSEAVQRLDTDTRHAVTIWRGEHCLVNSFSSSRHVVLYNDGYLYDSDEAIDALEYASDFESKITLEVLRAESERLAKVLSEDTQS